LKKYFCISTDKATAPINMMGASKRIMEICLAGYEETVKISTARFANVAFSDGSLLDSFTKRLINRQPISAPYDIKRYFLTHVEAAELCLFSCFLGQSQEIFMPKISNKIKAISFSEVASRFLEYNQYQPILCDSEEEARSYDLNGYGNKWPCYFFKTDTTGEKEIEIFYETSDIIDLQSFDDIALMKIVSKTSGEKFDNFIDGFNSILKSGNYSKTQIVSLFKSLIDNFEHNELGRNLDQKM